MSERPPMPPELAELLESGRDVRIPISSPSPVTEADADRLYSFTHECTIGTDPDGDYVMVDEDAETVGRVLEAMRRAGFTSVFQLESDSETLHVQLSRVEHVVEELRFRVEKLEESQRNTTAS